MTILFINELSISDVRCFDKSVLTFAQLKQRTDPNKHLSITLTDTTGTIVANFSKLLKENPQLVACPTWTEVEAYLTRAKATLYKEDVLIPPYMEKMVNSTLTVVPNTFRSTPPSLNILSAMHSKVDVSYGSYLSPTSRNNPNTRHSLKDIVFSLRDKSIANINSSIPVVNGKVCFPIVINNELYAINASKFIKSAKIGSIGTMLIDFSTLGTTEFIKFSDCTSVQSNVYSLPTGKSFANKSAVLVIDGRLFFRDEFSCTEGIVNISNCVRFIDTLEYSNKVLEHSNIFATPNYYKEVSTFDITKDDNFIILIDTKKTTLAKTKPIMNINRTSIKFPKFSGGLLIRKATKEIIDYSRQEEDDSTVIFFSDREPFFKLATDNKDSRRSLVFSKTSSKRFIPKTMNADSVGLELINLTR